VRLMNAKARELGMRDTRYVEPTGLSSLNQSSARDLATLVSVAYQHPILRSLSTSPSHQLDLGHRILEFRNSNGLIRNPDWDIGLQKTGYISEAGRCLVMQARVAGRQLIMVFLDATGKLGRAQDAERVRRWVEAQPFHPAVAVRPQG
jgi:serine-type D-Ala-D-Ala endopeptidase (penicillin-binding protein 7)